jgi:hypothetical protein
MIFFYIKIKVKKITKKLILTVAEVFHILNVL